MKQNNLLQGIVDRLDRMEKDNKEFRQETTKNFKEVQDEFKKVHTSIRGLKMKTTKTWHLFHYFTKNADEKIVKTARRVDRIEAHLGLSGKN